MFHSWSGSLVGVLSIVDSRDMASCENLQGSLISSALESNIGVQFFYNTVIPEVSLACFRIEKRRGVGQLLALERDTNTPVTSIGVPTAAQLGDVHVKNRAQRAVRDAPVEKFQRPQILQ